MNRERRFYIPALLRETIRVTAVAFVVLTVIGYVMQRVKPETVVPLLDALASLVEDNALAEADSAALFGAILMNNLSALFSAILLGLIPFIRLPAMELGVNALLLGAMGAYYQQRDLSLAAYLAGTLPHGVTELTALVFAIAAGLNLCRAVSDALLRRGEKGAIPRAFAVAMLLYARFIVPLLLVSALIESFVTPALLAAFL